MKLLEYMAQQSLIAAKLTDENQWEQHVSAVDAHIRKELNINRGAMLLSEDWQDVMDWLGAPCSALCDVDVCEGGVYYYYLCRVGIA